MPDLISHRFISAVMSGENHQTRADPRAGLLQIRVDSQVSQVTYGGGGGLLFFSQDKSTQHLH